MTIYYSFTDHKLDAGDCQKYKYFESLEECERYVKDGERTGDIRYGIELIRKSVHGTIFKEQA